MTVLLRDCQSNTTAIPVLIKYFNLGPPSCSSFYYFILVKWAI